MWEMVTGWWTQAAGPEPCTVRAQVAGGVKDKTKPGGGCSIQSTRRRIMSPYVTRVQIWFNSEGTTPSKIIQKLTAMGFTPVRGAYDFIYRHKAEDMNSADLSTAILDISDALHSALAGFKVLFTLDTHYTEDSDDYVPLELLDAELEATRRELLEAESEAAGHLGEQA